MQEKEFLSTRFKDKFYFTKGSFVDMFKWIFVEWKMLGINDQDIVVDFGSGSRPLLRANILVDKAVFGVYERPVEFLDTGVYVIQSSLENLPFKDKSVTFGFCSHTVEHLEDLERSLDEMSRVCKRGFLACPSRIKENILGFRMHLWFIEKRGKELIFTRKRKPYTEEIGDYFEKMLISSRKYVWYNFERELREDFEIRHFWIDRIRYRVIRQENGKGWKNPGDTVYSVLHLNSFIALLRRSIYRISASIICNKSNNMVSIENILCCPSCKKDLVFTETGASCSSCSRFFPRIGAKAWDFTDTKH